MYKLLIGCEVAHLSHMTESAVYAVALGKEVDPIDVYNKVHEGSFYHINKNLFNNNDPYNWMQKALNSPKSGIVNPELQENWQKQMEMYFEYIMEKREEYKYDYVSTTRGYDYR
jgi:tetrahydrodipicolinate N-succinyltransferase